MFNAQRRQGRGQDKRERQAKPKIWEALGAKPISHKLLPHNGNKAAVRWWWW